ncbi:MAG: ABC transporter ATP-binding protein [Bacteroidetes bacterium]|nr:ABC transporter ATP-binding protein [Bacteroidota bacterium]MBL7103017.1 ATP-binding cassette domain-containing protein [Bacteroidales bacterium]
MNVLFEAQNITKQFANHKALDEVSISVPGQSIFGLLGPNGAGKTTLIRIINQITAPDNGRLFFCGEKLQSRHIEKIGYLPEERGLYKKMKVGEQALYLARLKGLSKADALKKLREWFEKFEIQAWWNKKVEELSKGMQQKVQFIVTIIHEPELLIFDEPFSGFDPINVNLLKDEILRIKENGGTIIFSTHNMASVEELCDHIALIDKSKKILEGRVKDIKKEYKSNTYEINYTNRQKDLIEILSNNFKIIEQAKDEDTLSAKIRIMNGKNQNDLLRELLPYVSIHSFNEILPTMNDIFISKVRENE